MSTTDLQPATTSPTVAADCSEVWRRAGEFFGLLQRKLGWGSLVMSSPVACEVAFQWQVTIRGKEFVVEESLTFKRLADNRTAFKLDDLAQAWCDNWKSILSNRG